MENNTMTQVVGQLKFDNRLLDVYSSLNEPIFRLSDVGDMIDYSDGNTWAMTSMLEEDEKLNLTMLVGGQRRTVSFVTETGLYNILSQSRKPLARKWRRIIHDQLIRIRKEHNRNVIQQFDEWNHELDTLYIDPDTGILMQSITVAGGDVEQVIYRGKR